MRKKEKLIGIIAMVIIGAVFLAVGYFNSTPKKNEDISLEEMFVEEKEGSKGVNSSNNNSESNLKESSNYKNEENNLNNKEIQKDSLNKIVVEIRGEVKNPNVYYIEENKIINDLITLAGGLTEEADIRNINRAKKLNNHDLVIIQSKAEVDAGITIPPSNDSTINSKSSNGDSSNDKDSIININTASKEELMNLPSVGEKTAEKIIEYREKNGGFKNIEDIKNIDRIGDKTFEKFKNKITT